MENKLLEKLNTKISDDYWYKKEFDKNGNEIYFENSNGTIVDNRPSNGMEDNIR